MHHLDSNETLEEKARRELNKNAAWCFEQNPGSSTPIKQLLYGHLPVTSQTIEVK